MTAADFLQRLGEAEGHAEDMPVEGEVSLIPPFCHRPVCSDSKTSNQTFQKSTLVWLGARHQGCVYLKGNAEESVFLWQHPCT